MLSVATPHICEPQYIMPKYTRGGGRVSPSHVEGAFMLPNTWGNLHPQGDGEDVGIMGHDEVSTVGPW